jgi:hypothetical protein
MGNSFISVPAGSNLVMAATTRKQHDYTQFINKYCTAKVKLLAKARNETE